MKQLKINLYLLAVEIKYFIDIGIKLSIKVNYYIYMQKNKIIKNVQLFIQSVNEYLSPFPK